MARLKGCGEGEGPQLVSMARTSLLSPKLQLQLQDHINFTTFALKVHNSQFTTQSLSAQLKKCIERQSCNQDFQICFG
jgi:hypothetical protein